ncbi:hypothetical protein BEL05_06180 [Shewanella colwelliana]|uniref:Lysozyme inhibitor LprI-like N-terminal domain-containing protein n=1 Tax=Shewanella colwelliana TaxID=23 RepID=A0A1E5IT78_SHECO|nr:lysozyme inhibitor LprI family protein [Shewanella colwelliana]OEG73657.1 hypothetical protein BEL05_06180 [Shewanella colwelliana]
MKFLILTLIFILTPLLNVYAASFDCSVKLNITEKAICSNTVLNLLDEELSKYYSKHLKSLTETEKKHLISKQRKWLSERNTICSDNAGCLLTVYASRIEELSFKPKKVEKVEKVSGTYSHKPERDSFNPKIKCDFSGVKFSSDLVVYAGGAYSGSPTIYQIDESGHRTTKFDVAVNSPDSPVALFLSAYEPSIWNIKWTENTKIEAVYASGYYKQVIIGLPNNVPVITTMSREAVPCTSLYIEPKTLHKVNPLSLRLFNKKVSLVTKAKRGNLGFGDAFSHKTPFFTNVESNIDEHIDPIFSFSGKYGLNQLISKGYIREYSEQDVNRWVKLKSDQLMESLPPVAGIDVSSKYKPDIYISQRAYVILKKIRIPAGLFGADSVVFFLKENVPYPDGKLGHSKLYDFNTLKCKGTGCNR